MHDPEFVLWLGWTMQVPVKLHYATLAMLALAEQYETRQPLPARVIAREQGIPGQFLGQLLQQLRTAGLVTSTRGSNGGFLLERAPERVSVAEIKDAICPGVSAQPTSASNAGSTNLAESVSRVWQDMHDREHQLLSSVTLAGLLRDVTPTDPMFYI